MIDAISQIILAQLTEQQSQINELNKVNLEALKPNEADIVGIEGASKFLGLSKSRIYTLCCKNLIPHFKKGRLYFSIITLTLWVKEGKVNTLSDHRRNADKLLNNMPLN